MLRLFVLLPSLVSGGPGFCWTFWNCEDEPTKHHFISNPELLHAVEQGDLRKANQTVAKGGDLYERFSNYSYQKPQNCTPKTQQGLVFVAIANGHQRIAEWLLGEGVVMDFEAVDDQGVPLYTTCCPNDTLRRFWKEQVKLSFLGMLSDKWSWAVTMGGVLLAAVLVWFQGFLEGHDPFLKLGSLKDVSLQDIPTRMQYGGELPKDFHSGARLLVAKKRATWMFYLRHFSFRFAEVTVNIVMVFGMGMLVVAWFAWLPLVCMVFVGLAWMLDWKLADILRMPALAFSLSSRSRAWISLLRCVTLAGVVLTVYLRLDSGNPHPWQNAQYHRLKAVYEIILDQQALPDWLRSAPILGASLGLKQWRAQGILDWFTKLVLVPCAAIYLLSLLGIVLFQALAFLCDGCGYDYLREDEKAREEEMNEQRSLVRDLRIGLNPVGKEARFAIYQDAFLCRKLSLGSFRGTNKPLGPFWLKMSHSTFPTSTHPFPPEV